MVVAGQIYLDFELTVGDTVIIHEQLVSYSQQLCVHVDRHCITGGYSDNSNLTSARSSINLSAEDKILVSAGDDTDYRKERRRYASFSDALTTFYLRLYLRRAYG